VEDVVTAPNEARVVCPHGQAWRFVASSVPGVWIIPVQGAERVTYPDDGVERWHYSMRCDRCGLNVPMVNPDAYGPILDRLMQADSPAIRRVAPNVVEVPLKLMAKALGATGIVPLN
jgi:hypothetical protein